MDAKTKLSLKVKGLYPTPMSDADALSAAGRLVSFFKILGDIDKQQKRKNDENFRSENTASSAT
jgi:hypothetical protein